MNQTKSSEPLGTATRRASLRVLDAVLRRGEPLETALSAATRNLPGGPDRGLAHAIAAETLRRLPDLDALIDSATKQRLPDDAKARTALRIALVQVLSLGTPPHAAISTVLPLVDGGPRKLVHGVFGTLMREGARLPELPTLPAETAARWRASWGDDVAAAAARLIAAPPPLDLSFKPGRAAGWPADVAARALAADHLRLADAASVPDLPGYAEGDWWVQDVAATIPARLIGAPSIGAGQGSALDLCAAPGGKTCQLAAAGWQVTAVDASPSRAARLRDNLARTALGVDVVVADILTWDPATPFDAVLVDAPCSASGIFRRHPDVLHRARAGVVAEMADTQRRILARAADWVRPGGVMVYATCSLEPEEGEAQIEAFLTADARYTLEPPRGDELPAGIPVATRGWVRTLPGMLEADGGCDGFFIARLRRASA